jgi:hypothetical protein
LEEGAVPRAGAGGHGVGGGGREGRGGGGEAEDAAEVGAEVGGDDEASGGVEDYFVRVGCALPGWIGAWGREGEGEAGGGCECAVGMDG